MATIVLGADGKLGGVLKRHALRVGRPWRFQARTQDADLFWSGQIGHPSSEAIFQPGNVLINLIGATQGDANHLHDTNVIFVEELLSKAATTGVSHVLLASSAAVYGAGHSGMFTETSPLSPISDYARSKVRMEKVAHDFAGRHTTPAITILRIGNVAGSDALLYHARKFSSQQKPMPLHRFADGQSALRSYIGPSDLFSTIDTLTEVHSGIRTLNIAAPTAVYLEPLLEAYRSHILPDIRWHDEPAPAAIPPRVVLATDRLGAVIDTSQMAQTADAIAKQVAEDVTR